MPTKRQKQVIKAVKSIAFEILQVIKDLSELIPEPFEDKFSYQRRLRRRLPQYTNIQINRGLYDLRRKNLIEKKSFADKIIYRLTPSAKLKMLKRNLFKKKVRLNDGNSTIVIFDIPEEQSRTRSFLRRFLLQNGFINLQKSVLIGPYSLPKEFNDFLEELKIRPNVTVIRGRILY